MKTQWFWPFRYHILITSEQVKPPDQPTDPDCCYHCPIGGGASSSSGEPGRGKPTLLTSELSQFNTFKKLLKVGDKRASLHQMLQVTSFAKIE